MKNNLKFGYIYEKIKHILKDSDYSFDYINGRLSLRLVYKNHNPRGIFMDELEDLTESELDLKLQELITYKYFSDYNEVFDFFWISLVVIILNL